MVGLMVRYWRYLLLAVVLVAVLILLGIAKVVAEPDIQKFVTGGAIVAAIVAGMTGAIFGIGLARSR